MSKSLKIPTLLDSSIHEEIVIKPFSYTKLLYSRKRQENKDKVFINLRKKLLYIRHILIKKFPQRTSILPFSQKYRSQSNKTIFKILKKVRFTERPLKLDCYFLREKKTLGSIEMKIRNIKSSGALWTTLFKKNTIMNLRSFAFIREIGQWKPNSLLLLINSLSKCQNLKQLRLDIDYHGFSHMKEHQYHLLRGYLLRFKFLENISLGSLRGANHRFFSEVARIFGKLPNLKEFHPKVNFLNEKSQRELEFMKALSGSKSLRDLNLNITGLPVKNIDI